MKFPKNGFLVLGFAVLTPLVLVPTIISMQTQEPESTQSPTSSVSPSASGSPAPSSSPTASAGSPRPQPTAQTDTFVNENRILVSSMHSILDDMIERALYEQMDVLMTRNDELRVMLEKLKASAPPSVISETWQEQLLTTEREVSVLRQASLDYSNRQISADDYLNNFAPLRIELVALDALLDQAGK